MGLRVCRWREPAADRDASPGWAESDGTPHTCSPVPPSKASRPLHLLSEGHLVPVALVRAASPFIQPGPPASADDDNTRAGSHPLTFAAAPPDANVPTLMRARS